MKKKCKAWGIFIIGILVGFIVCAHWHSGRNFVQEISPFYNASVNQGMQQLGQGLQQSGTKIKNKLLQ